MYICFYGEILNIIPKLSLLPLLTCSTNGHQCNHHSQTMKQHHISKAATSCHRLLALHYPYYQAVPMSCAYSVKRFHHHSRGQTRSLNLSSFVKMAKNHGTIHKCRKEKNYPKTAINIRLKNFLVKSFNFMLLESF